VAMELPFALAVRGAADWVWGVIRGLLRV